MKVTLKKPHTHAGKAYKKDDQIDVKDHDARWLQAHGVIDEASLRAAAAKAGDKPAAPSTPGGA